MAFSTLRAATMIEKDFSGFFGKYTGTIVVYDQEADRCFIHNRERSTSRFTPMSTFKIPNSLIALETGVISNIDQPCQWDTAQYPPQAWWPAQWNAKHTMRSAIKYSVVPFYRTIANQVGQKRMVEYIHKFNYGNEDISSGIDAFWLDGSLRISAMEQIDFLKRFYTGTLGVSAKTTAAVKEILIQERNPAFMLSAKTGGGALGSGPAKALGWYVGYIERGDKVWFFACNIDGESFADIMSPRIDITKAVLKKLGIIE
jgi:beta-lactamase class D